MRFRQILTSTAVVAALGLVVPAIASPAPTAQKAAPKGNAIAADEKTQTPDDPCKWCTPCSQTPASACLKCCTSAKRAEAAVAEMEKTVPGSGVATAGEKTIQKDQDKSIQKELDKQHKKARDGGYDKEFHQAIRDKGGERLKEEWKSNCNSRPPKKRELNCY
jgi:hypothetical protein